MLAAVATALLLLGAVLVLIYQGFALLLAAQMPRLDAAPPPSTPVRRPKVSVVIAARDEEDDLPDTLASLVAQDYPDLEVVVVDGGSTPRLRGEIADRFPSVRRLEEPPLPPGWVGKNWACTVGARATGGEWLLFVDADLRLAPSAVRSTVDWAEREGAALVSLAPRVAMVTFWERVVLPFYIQLILTRYRAPHVNRPTSRTALANGQYWLVRRSDYEALEGHAAVRDQLLEDVAIAARFRTAGRPLRIAWAPELAQTRMYRDRSEMFEGLLKNVHGLRFSAVREAGFLTALVGLFWLPLGLLPLGIALGSLPLAVAGGLLALALFGKHVAFARAVGAPARYGLLYPLAVGFYVGVVGTSLARGLRRGTVRWKGRTYPLRP